MKTAFTPSQLARPEIGDADRILRACVHYGFCTAVCPTYVLLRDENDAPRGRIDLIRAMLEKGGPPDAKTVGHIDRCLSCNACMTTCAAKVDFLHLADIGRAHIERHFRRPLGDRLLRRLVAAVLTSPSFFRWAMRGAALARPIARMLPKRLARMIEIAPRRLAPPSEMTKPGVYPALGKRRMRVALLTGCVQQALAPHINAATIRLLTRHGCDVVVADTGCCGALVLHMGKEIAAKTSARRALAAWQAAGDLDAIVVNASGCGTTVKDYGTLFQHEPQTAALAASIGRRARDVSELVFELGLQAPARPVPLALAYHDACSLQHAQKVIEPPRALLRQAGFDLHDVPERHFCCGSAGTYNLLQPDLARRLGERKAAHIAGTGAAAIAAGNLGCLTQIGLYTSLPVLHTVELLDWATGGPLPGALVGLTLPSAREAHAAPADTAIW